MGFSSPLACHPERSECASEVKGASGRRQIDVTCARDAASSIGLLPPVAEVPSPGKMAQVSFRTCKRKMSAPPRFDIHCGL